MLEEYEAVTWIVMFYSNKLFVQLVTWNTPDGCKNLNGVVMLVISVPAGQLYILYERVHGENVEKYVEAVKTVYGVAND